jgi:hypothetical protein
VNQVDSLRVARDVLQKISLMLMENGEVETSETLQEVVKLLNDMQTLAFLNPAEFTEFAVGTMPPEPSDN